MRQRLPDFDRGQMALSLFSAA